MIQKWLESIILRRVCLTLAKALCAYAISHARNFSAAGITVTIETEKFSDFMNIAALGGLSWLHHYVIKRWPEIGKYL